MHLGGADAGGVGNGLFSANYNDVASDFEIYDRKFKAPPGKSPAGQREHGHEKNE